MFKIIEVNNQRKIKIESSNLGLLITKIDSNGNIEARFQITEDEIVMLLNLYQSLLQQDKKSAYLLDDFAHKILQDTRGIDYIQEFKIIQ